MGKGTKIDILLKELSDLPVVQQLHVYSTLAKQVNDCQQKGILDLFGTYPTIEVHKPKSIESLRLTVCKHTSWKFVGSVIEDVGSLLGWYGFSYDIHCIHTVEGKGVISVQIVITPVPSLLRFLIKDLDDASISAEELRDLLMPSEDNKKK